MGVPSAAVMGVRWAFDGFSLETAVTLVFGDLVLDTGTRQLLRRDVELRLSPKAFELLLLLCSLALLLLPLPQ